MVDSSAHFREEAYPLSVGGGTFVDPMGERDALLPHEEQERRAAAIPDATLRVYPDTGHAVAGERPEWVVRDLEAFMREARSA
jgi:alpha-beta hydrolase superfamily lysophospholipase